MKRILLIVAAIAAVATAGVWFAAEESYVTTIKTTIGTSLVVTPHGSQDLGLLFGQESRSGRMSVAMNPKAAADANLLGVDFTIDCNPGPAGHDICENLTLSPTGLQKLFFDSSPLQLQWLFIAPDCEQAAQKKDDPKTVPCDQDTNWDLSGEISIDVFGYQGTDKQDICDKKTLTLFDGKTGQQILIDTDGDTVGDTPVACTL